MIFRKLFFSAGCIASSMMGVQVVLWFQEPFPADVHRRIVLTPVVKAGEEARIGFDVYRKKNCPVRVSRRTKYADGDYSPSTEIKDKDFGPLGPDDYVMRVATGLNAPKGRVKLYSQACSQCNWIQQLSIHFAMCIPPTTDEWEIGDKTEYRPNPEGFDPTRELSMPTK